MGTEIFWECTQNCTQAAVPKEFRTKRKTAQPYWLSGFLMARQEGFEPPTLWFVARYSIQLSYWDIKHRENNDIDC